MIHTELQIAVWCQQLCGLQWFGIFVFHKCVQHLCMKSAREILKTSSHSVRILCWHQYLFIGFFLFGSGQKLLRRAECSFKNNKWLPIISYYTSFFFLSETALQLHSSEWTAEEFCRGGNNKRAKSQAASGKVKCWGGTRSWRGSNSSFTRARLENGANKTM